METVVNRQTTRDSNNKISTHVGTIVELKADGGERLSKTDEKRPKSKIAA
jgi:uncharacterized protein Veg